MLKRRLLICFALLAPIVLGGCEEDLCGGSTEHPLVAVLVGFLCLGYPDSDGGGPKEPHPEFEVRPSVVQSGDTATLDARGSEPSPGKSIVRYRWDADGDYRVGARGRFFDFEVVSGNPVVSVRLFRRDPAIVRPPGEIIDNGESETRIVALSVTQADDHRGQNPRIATTLGRVTITGDPRPPAAEPLVASFTVSPEQPVAGGGVTLDASASRGATSFSWDLDGDGSFETGPLNFPLIMTDFETPGLHRVRLRVTDAHGLTAEQPREIFVAPAPPRGSGARARAARGTKATPVSARLARVRFPAEFGPPRRAGRARVFGPLKASGRLIAAADELGQLRPLRRSSWVARVRLLVRPRVQVVRMRGVALATFRRGAGTACLRIRMRGRTGRVPTGRIRVIGGTGNTAELKGGGRFRYRFEGRTPRLEGRLTLRKGAARALPRACARLR